AGRRRGGDVGAGGAASPAAWAAFFASWRGELASARKWLAAARHYAMARLAGEVGLRLRELCWPWLEDLHFEQGPLGKIHVRMGKGSRGSGPRERLGPRVGGARPLPVWGGQEGRGQFTDEWELPRAVLFPSERGGPIGGDTFATALGQAASQHLRGPVTKLTPHVLRHAYASRLHGECLSAAWRGHRPGRDPAALGAPVAVHHGPLRARRRRGDRKRLPAGGRAGRRPVQGVE